jgi:hypothetical protein
MATLSEDLWQKRLGLLREIAPKISRLAVLWNPGNPGNTSCAEEIKAAAPTMGMQLRFLEVSVVAGIGSYGPLYLMVAPISGEWTIDDNGRICTSMRMGTGGGASPGLGVTLPSRCQFWFKYADQYFLSDSDSDRRARVLRRTVKQ